ncbi:spermidine/putrescine ABC transporter substrate-binding protein [Chelatococcus sambhunathii]|uniref:Spermidine/putrescine ABC transporter substrate-binding protein n=1 Tax=Chelatococcus sambhunathii TaxID=363953 RepID=A0ABU1DG22_9HYPH|nr:spermidine/putrescine ABC transporter substrate-binding protein [Chelatococcus sambhunathii]MDR4307076.1 spermidine/putrescine ABC transporter substrate-binding protein [Chelatococcus sambhunathii]
MPKTALFALLAALAVAFPARAETLNLLNWEKYIDQSILDAWTAKTGVAVRQTFFDSGDARDEILTDPLSNVDLVVISDNAARLYGRRGVLDAFDQKNVASLAEYPEDLRARCGAFGVPYFTGTMGILYRSDKVSVPPTSWNDLMNPASALKGHVAMYNDPTEMFVAPLIALGKSINASDEPTLRAAFELLKAQGPAVRTYDYILTSSQDRAYGDELYMALGYSGDQFALNETPKSTGDWKFAVPREGTLYWLDCMSVVATSPRKALALDLLNHVASAPNALTNAVRLRRPTPNLKALAETPEDMRKDEMIYPPAEVLEKSEAPRELTPEGIQIRRRIISSLVNFRDAR